MGGRPVTALNIVGYPDDELPLDWLHEILRGGAEKVTEAGAVILGGHSVRDREIKYGLAVTGLVDPARLISNAGARPGQALVLTKPIGTGAMTAAYQKNKIDEALWDACTRMMSTLNRAASEAMIEAGATGATDITGYGLLGHAAEMAEASDVTLEIDSKKVPRLDGALDLYKAGFVTRAVSTNLAWLEPRMDVPPAIDEPLLHLLADAQTSGGLLIALPEENVDRFGELLRAKGPAYSFARIGRVLPRAEKALRLV